MLHGEQYLSIKKPIPTSGTLVSTARIMEVLDKGKAAAVTLVVETRDHASNETIFESQSTVFIRGSGGFGGRKTGKGVYTWYGGGPEVLMIHVTQTVDLLLLLTAHRSASQMQLLRRRPCHNKPLFIGKTWRLL